METTDARSSSRLLSNWKAGIIVGLAILFVTGIVIAGWLYLRPNLAVASSTQDAKSTVNATDSGTNLPYSNLPDAVITQKRIIDVEYDENGLAAIVLARNDSDQNGYPYRMDLGDVGENYNVDGLMMPVACVGEFALPSGEFSKGGCILPKVGDEMQFHFVPGTIMLINMTNEDWRSDSPRTAYIWRAAVPLDTKHELETDKLKSPWHEIAFKVLDGDEDGATIWTILPLFHSVRGALQVIDGDKQTPMTLQCVGLHIPRGTEMKEVLIPNICPNLKANVNEANFRVQFSGLTTRDDSEYYFGIESDSEKTNKPYFLYKLLN